MKRRPLGVWFSLALGILLLSLWMGLQVGSAIAGYWYRHHKEVHGKLSGSEWTRVESELAELSAVQTLQLYAIAAHHLENRRDKYLLNEIQQLGEIRRRSKDSEIKSLVDLDIGLAYVQAAVTEEQNANKELAKTYMKSAQALLASLGWQDYSEETLKAVAKRELDKWGQTNAREK